LDGGEKPRCSQRKRGRGRQRASGRGRARDAKDGHILRRKKDPSGTCSISQCYVSFQAQSGNETLGEISALSTLARTDIGRDELRRGPGRARLPLLRPRLSLLPRDWPSPEFLPLALPAGSLSLAVRPAPTRLPVCVYPSSTRVGWSAKRGEKGPSKENIQRGEKRAFHDGDRHLLRVNEWSYQKPSDCWQGMLFTSRVGKKWAIQLCHVRGERITSYPTCHRGREAAGDQGQREASAGAFFGRLSFTAGRGRGRASSPASKGLTLHLQRVMHFACHWRLFLALEPLLASAPTDAESDGRGSHLSARPSTWKLSAGTRVVVRRSLHSTPPFPSPSRARLSARRRERASSSVPLADRGHPLLARVILALFSL